MAGEIKTKNGQASVVVGNTFLFLVQTTAATSEQWRWCVTQLQDHAAKHPEGFIFFQLILPSADPPSAAIRGQIQSDLASLGPKMTKMITVVFGDSMRQSIVRTLMRGMLLLGGLSRQQTIVSTVREGSELLQQAPELNAPARSELTAAANSLFEALHIDPITFTVRDPRQALGSLRA